METSADLGKTRPLSWPGLMLGFGLGGFFDGILLHQVLQWHHLLSAVEGEGLRDIRVQILADGLFHILMYVIVAGALWRLWRRRGLGQADGYLVADAILGFGLWQLVDIVLFHWILQIHHIRMEADSWIAWDIGWFLIFGAPALALGWLLRRRPPRPGAGPGAALQLGLAITVIAAGGLAAMPPRGASAVMVMFGPGADAAGSLRALAASGASVMWMHPTGAVAAVAADGELRTRDLYSNGAILISRSSVPAGCFSWTRT